MRSLKSLGGLTRGSGMSEHQRAVWTMSSISASSYNLAMQEMAAVHYTAREQHKELSSPRMTRDASDIQKIMEKLTTFSPFNQEPSLRNIITGVNATECVNVHELFTVGERWKNNQSLNINTKGS